MSMSEIDRFYGHFKWIDLDFVEGKRTPDQLSEIRIQLNLVNLSLSNIK